MLLTACGGGSDSSAGNGDASALPPVDASTVDTTEVMAGGQLATVDDTSADALMEPIFSIEVVVPEEYLGDVIGDAGEFASIPDDVVMKTCSLAVLRCDIDSWGEFGSGGAELGGLFHPRELPD